MQDLERLMERPVGRRRELKMLEKLRRSLGWPEAVMSSMMAVQETFESAAERARSGWRPKQKRRQPRAQPCLGPVSEGIVAATSPLLTTSS